MKKWLLCAVFFLVAAAFACLGMFHLERAASCLPEGIIYADPNGVVQQPMEEDALDSSWIASYVKEGEWVTFLLFSSQVATAGEAEQLVTSLLGLGAGELRYAVLIVDDSHLGNRLSHRPDDALQLSGHLIGVG